MNKGRVMFTDLAQINDFAVVQSKLSLHEGIEIDRSVFGQLPSRKGSLMARSARVVPHCLQHNENRMLHAGGNRAFAQRKRDASDIA